MQIIVDTNVYLDLFLEREGAENAEQFFLWCRKYKVKPFITAMTLRDIGYIANKIMHNKQRSRQIQMKAYQISNKVIGLSADSAIESLYNDGDYEDRLIINTAKENMMDAIVTNNLKDFQDSPVPVFLPEDIAKVKL